MTYKWTHRQCFKSHWYEYHYRIQHSNYRASSCRDVQILRRNLGYVKKGWSLSVLIKAWNDIPIEIIEVLTLNEFKIMIFNITNLYTGCPSEKIVPLLCCCCEGGVVLIISVFVQLHRVGFNLDFEILYESSWHVVADLW